LPFNTNIVPTSTNIVDLDEFYSMKYAISRIVPFGYEGSQYVICNGSPIKATAGIVFHLPAYYGVLQVFAKYNEPKIYIRQRYAQSWSSWKLITTTDSSPF